MVIIMVMMVVLVLIMMSMAITAGDETGKKICSSGICDYHFEEGSATSCHHLLIHGANFADCNGEYLLSNTSVSWAPDKPVYKHVDKNR